MADPKLEKLPPNVVFNSQSKNESQDVVNQPRHVSPRRLIRILLTLGVGYYLFSLYLQFNTAPKAIFLKHGHRSPSKPGRFAEDMFLSTPNAKSAIRTSRQYAGKPHLAGTDGDFATAELFLSTLQDAFRIKASERKPVFDAGTHESQDATQGIVERESPSAWIDTYYPVMNTPLERSLQILDHRGNVIWDADLKEHAPEGGHADPDAAEYADEIPTFHGLSVSGDVTGHLIHGNYCTKDDYDDLVAQGAPLKGSIVLCRYGSIFRGLKVKGGQENGAVGVLIYSDPRDDGPVTVDNGYAPYPEGPARNPTSVQRGSVQFLSIYPGDPTTPGYPSYENATRKEGTNIPSIPSLPISWDNAKQLLRVLQDGSPFKGRHVRLANHVHTRVIPIWNVIGVIPGIIKNEVVVAGNHRDAWVLGAVDPSSGTVSTHEVIRGFGRLMEKGWKPLRTIVIASWDAEEYGLIGSTEWGEDFADWIDKHVVAYFNLDSSVSGSRFGTSGSPLLAHFIRDTARDVPHPTVDNKTLWDAREDSGVLAQPDSSGRSDAIKIAQTELEVAVAMANDLGVSPLGSGSDYTVFLQRNGVPSTNEGFSSTLNDPVYHYHSVFDSEPWQERYGDPGFSRHIAVAQHFGLQIMRLANAPLLPFNTTYYSLQLESYLDAVENLPETKELRLDLRSLRSVIHGLQKASLKLDEEKHQVWKELKDVARRWWRHSGKRHHRHHDRDHDHDRHRHHNHGSDYDHSRDHHDHRRHHHGHHGKFDLLRGMVDRVEAWFATTLLRQDYYHSEHIMAAQTCGRAMTRLNHPSQTQDGEQKVLEESELPLLRHPLALLYELESKMKDDRAGGDDHGHKHEGDKKKHKKLRKDTLHALRRVHAVNTKLRSFERGLISKEGIKDREWFKHLGVAPGKWLGYGATTLPGLTEAIVFDKDKRAAEHEAKRLVGLVEKLIKKLKV